MKRFALYAASAAIAFTSTAAQADEGMWTFDGFPTERMEKTYGWAPDQAWLDRVQQAQYNTWEACICTVSTFYVAASLDLSETLFAKMATLLLLIRVLYPIVYGLDLDFLRTTLWLMGIHTCLMTAFAGLFAESVVPMLT